MAFDVRQYAKRKMEQENQAEVQGTSASRVNKINTGEQKFDVRAYARAQGKAASPKAQVNTQASAVKRPTIGMQARKLEGTEYGRMLDAYRRGEDASVLMGQPERFTDDEYRASVERVLGRTVDWDAENAYSAVQDMLRGASDQRTGTRSAYREAGIEGLEDMVTYLRAREQRDARIAEQQERIQAAQRAYADNEAWFRSLYETYSQMPDFEEMSRYSPPDVNERMAVWTGADLSHIGMQGPGVVYNVRRQMYENPTYVYVNDSTQRGSLDMASGTTIFGGNRLETSSNQAAGYDQLTPEEVQVYNYIYATQGAAAADRFLLDAENGIAPMLQYRAQNANAQRVGEAAKESPYFATAVSFPYRVADVMVAPTKMLATAMGTYDETLDHFRNTVSSIRDNAKQEVAADLDGLLPDGFVRGFASVAGKTPGEMAYDVGVNIVDMAVSRSIAGAMPGATQYMSPQEVKNVGRLAIGLMSLGATGSRISEGIQEGETPQRALVNGVAEGAMEALTEKLPMEAWMSDPGNAWQYLAKNFLSEGGEEGVNAVMQQAWDLMFNGENSRFAVTMQEAIASGKNGNDAFVIAFADALQEVLVSSVEGGLSGAMSAAPVASASAASNLYDTAKERSGRKATADFFDQINTSVLGGEFSREGKGIAAIRTQGEAIAAELDRRASEMTGDTANYMRNLAAEVMRGVTTTATVGREWKQYADELIAESRDMGETDLNRQAAERLEKKGKVSNRMLGDVYRENLIRQAQMEGETETEADAETEAAPEDLEYKPGPATMKASVTTEAGSAEADILGVTGQGKDAVIRMRAADGAEVTVPVAEAEISDENTRALVDHAVELDYAQPMIAAYNRGQDAGLYATGFELAREYGYWNRMTEEQLLKSDVLTGLTDRQKLLAYQLGADARAARDAQEKEKTAARRERAREAARKAGKSGSVDESAIMGLNLTENQRAGVAASRQVAGALGIRIVWMRSKAELDEMTGNKVYRSDNGAWDPQTMTMYLDINAGVNVEGDMRFAVERTMMHEVTHYVYSFADESLIRAYEDFVITQAMRGDPDGEIRERLEKAKFGSKEREEIVAEASENVTLSEETMTRLAEQNRTLWEKIRDFLKKWVEDLRTALAKAKGTEKNALNTAARAVEAVQEEVDRMFGEALVSAQRNRMEAMRSDEAVDAAVEAQEAVTPEEEVRHSERHDEDYYRAAVKMNTKKYVASDVMDAAHETRMRIRAWLAANREKLGLPEDIEGNTWFSDAAYGGSHELTTVCPRSLGNEHLMDLIAEYLGRPLTVQDTLVISQEAARYVGNRQECFYCYVATDRRAYREYLGSYLKDRDAALAELRKGRDPKAVYQEFLQGRKDTDNMKNRFDMWRGVLEAGEDLIRPGDVANISKMQGEMTELSERLIAAAKQMTNTRARNPMIIDDQVRWSKTNKRVVAELSEITEESPELKRDVWRYRQLQDAMAYAQSASWQKARRSFTAYDNGILKWSQKRIDSLNSMYGMRMYSFSDYSPAFLLENMQMITDAAVRGLKVLAYTKEIDFAKVFAPTGANINLSCFAYEQNGQISMDAMQGADWAEAQALRAKYDNVGVVMVTTSDAITEWAMQQDWIDTVIPYHLVRTGKEVAEYFGYTNYTHESSDKFDKGLGVAEPEHKSVYPTEHNNDVVKYADVLIEKGLQPRFKRWFDGIDEYRRGEITADELRERNPHYMKLVNEVRRTNDETRPVQPIFDEEAAMASLREMEVRGGYFVPVGGSYEVEADIAEEIAGKIREGEDVRKNERYDYGQYPNSAFYENGELYSYDFLTAQKEMTVVEVPTMEELDSNKEYRNIRKNALRQARENLENVAERREGDFYHLRNRYTQRIIKVAAGVAAHGLSTANQNPRRLFNNAANATKLGNLVQHAIPINGLKTIDNQVAGTYAMIAMTKDKNGREFINILTIEIRSETVTDVETFQQLHSANARKRKETLADKVGSGQPLQKQNATLSQSASPTISIRDLLAVVNRTHKSILSKDVLMRLNGTTETNGDYTDDAMFSKRSPTYPAALREAMGLPEDTRRSDRKRVYEVTDQELLLGAAINARTTEERRLLNQYKSAVMEYTEQREKMQPAHELVLEEKRLMEQNGGKDKTNYFAALNKENTVKRGMERAKRLIDELVKDPDLQRMIEREKNLMHGLTLTSEKQREAEARERIRTVVTERTEKLTEKLRKREREYRDNLIEQFSHERYFNAIERTSKSLTRKLTQPKTGAYVPEVLQKPILDLLTSIDAAYNDYDTVRNRKISEDMVRLAEVSRRLMDREAEAESETQDADTFLREIDLPRGLAEQFTDLAERVERAGKAKGGVLKNMTAAELKALSEALTIMNTAVENSNKLLANARYGTVEKLGTGSMGYLRKQRSSKSGGTKLGNYLNWRNATPVNAFDRFGDAGRSVFGELQDAQDKLAELAKKVIAFTGEAYKPEEAKAWSEEEVTIELGPEINPGDAIGSKAEEMGNTRKVTMTVAQAMSVYCLAKREAARHHMTGYRQEMRNEDGSKSEGFVKGGGIRIENYQRKGKGLRPGEKVVNSTNVWLSEADVEAIGKALTERQKSVATALQTYMSTTLSDWGNWVTLRRFGVHGFEEQNYFPMEVNPNALGTRSIEIKESLYRLLNMGFTKRLTERAKNPIMVRNIFDVFARHAGEMAMYRAYALPVLDAIKWLNYKESDTQTLQGEMERVFGREASNYVITLLQDINGKVGDNGVPELFDNLMRNYKIAAVGASLSTSLMQPTSYLRAAAMLDAKYLAIGARDALKNMEVAKTKVGIAQWKDLGYYDTNIGRSLASQIREGNQGKLFDMSGALTLKDKAIAVGKTMTDKNKVVELSMLLAKKGDEWTMGAIYGAVVAETQDLHPELKGEEFDAKVNERMRDIVYRTQVVDSPLMKSQFMRNKSYFAKLHTAFMAESTVTANLMMSYFWQASEAMRMGVSRGTAMKMYGRQAGRILTAWMAATALETLVRSLIGALRDDDDYENYGDKLLEQLPANFVKAVNPLSLVPLIGSGVEAILTGESVTDMSTEPLTVIYQAVKNIVNLIQGKDVTGYKVAYDLLRAISQATGIPISNATRDVIALWNTGMDAFDATGMKLQTYQDSDSKGYAALYDALVKGNEHREGWLRRQLALNGAEDEATRMRSLIKDDYNSGAIDADEAMRRLTEYAGDGENTAYWKVREWDAKAGGAETWSKADEVIDAILNGGDWRAEWQNLITYATSADYDDSDARSAVRSRIKTLLVNGRISEDTARWLLATCIYPTDREAREAVEAWLEAMEEEE